MEAKKTLTVAELVVLLQASRQDAKVYIEGCDCTGQAVGVDLEADGVMIRRNDGWKAADEAAEAEPVGAREFVYPGAKR